MADGKMAGADRSHEALLIAYLRGEPGDVARALVRILESGDIPNAADIIQAISSAGAMQVSSRPLRRTVFGPPRR